MFLRLLECVTDFLHPEKALPFLRILKYKWLKNHNGHIWCYHRALEKSSYVMLPPLHSKHVPSLFFATMLIALLPYLLKRWCLLRREFKHVRFCMLWFRGSIWARFSDDFALWYICIVSTLQHCSSKYWMIWRKFWMFHIVSQCLLLAYGMAVETNIWALMLLKKEEEILLYAIIIYQRTKRLSQSLSIEFSTLLL